MSAELCTKDFDYELPPELIAQQPPAERSGARLLKLERSSGEMSHRLIADLPELLAPGSLLVLNDSRVIPARLHAKRKSGGAVEILLVEQSRASVPGKSYWHALFKSTKTRSIKRGETLELQSSGATCAVRLLTDVIEGEGDIEAPEVPELLACGAMPLPPYIRRAPALEDSERYQTVFAREDGSIAAPTAGLHFSAALLDRLSQHSIEIAKLTLHVGPGTFRPVRTDDPRAHKLDAERYEISDSTASAIARAKQEGRPVVAVGTTVVRTLEATGGCAGTGRTDLLILPGHQFRVVDALLTNFHLPQSTLLMLVCAFAGREEVLAAYRGAVRERYRFYSYGDAMLIA